MTNLGERRILGIDHGACAIKKKIILCIMDFLYFETRSRLVSNSFCISDPPVSPLPVC